MKVTEIADGAAPDQPVLPLTPAPAHLRGDNPKPGPRIVFFVVAIALFMASVDQNIVATALPSIQHDLNARINWTSWTITIYALGQMLAIPLGGALTWRRYRRCAAG